MTKKEIYDKAMYEMAAKKQNSTDVSAMRKLEIYTKLPIIKELESELARTSVKLSKAIFAEGADSAAIINKIQIENIKLQNRITQLLKINGYDKDALNTKYECEKCSDSGFIMGEACQCLTELIKKISFEEFNRNSNIHIADFKEFSLQYYSKQTIVTAGFSEYDTMSKILGFCTAYAKSFTKESPNILMLGNTGLGKTHLSKAIASEVLSSGYTVLYGTAQEFFTQIQNEYFGRNSDSKDTYKDTLEADLLIIDDLGAEYEGAFNNTTFYNIVNARLNKNLPTIINTTLNLKQIESRYSNRAVSRLATLYKCLKFVGTDVRQQKLRQNNA